MLEPKVVGKDGGPARTPSTLSFPYSDISDAIAVAEAVSKGAGMALSRDQLAAAMGLSPLGGGFATKVATARAFGVIDAVTGKYQLTELGHEILDPSRRTDAVAKAFLNVELYRKVYDKFRGKRLPPRPHGLEAALVSFGVSPKSAKAARLAFDKSARMAGFFPTSEADRIMMPFGIGPTVAQVDETAAAISDFVQAAPPPAVSGIGTQRPSRLHSSIEGTLPQLPAPKSDWSKVDQADWLDALAGLFRVIYKSPGKGGEINVAYYS